MTTLLLCYHFIAPGISKGVIWDSVIFGGHFNISLHLVLWLSVLLLLVPLLHRENSLLIRGSGLYPRACTLSIVKIYFLLLNL